MPPERLREPDPLQPDRSGAGPLDAPFTSFLRFLIADPQLPPSLTADATQLAIGTQAIAHGTSPRCARAGPWARPRSCRQQDHPEPGTPAATDRRQEPRRCHLDQDRAGNHQANPAPHPTSHRSRRTPLPAPRRRRHPASLATTRGGGYTMVSTAPPSITRTPDDSYVERDRSMSFDSRFNTHDVHLRVDIEGLLRSTAAGCASTSLTHVARSGGAHLGTACHAQWCIRCGSRHRLNELRAGVHVRGR